MDGERLEKSVTLTFSSDEAIALKVILGKVVGVELKSEMIEDGFSVRTAEITAKLSYDLYNRFYDVVEENYGG